MLICTFIFKKLLKSERMWRPAETNEVNAKSIRYDVRKIGGTAEENPISKIKQWNIEIRNRNLGGDFEKEETIHTQT